MSSQLKQMSVGSVLIGKNIYIMLRIILKSLYEFAIQLIKNGKAYVDSLTAEEIRVYRGTLTEPGKESPYRNRSIEENLILFERMRNGEFRRRRMCAES